MDSTQAQTPAIIVRKGGFLTALVSGFFGTVIVCVLTGGALGLYALHIVDSRIVSTLKDAGGWRDVVLQVPIVADMLSDRRAPEYRPSLDVRAELFGGASDSAHLSITNKGSETVSLLTLRVVLFDDAGKIVWSENVAGATPLALGDRDIVGPLLPGEGSRVLRVARRVAGAVRATVEVTDVRVFTPRTPPAAESPALPTASLTRGAAD